MPYSDEFGRFAQYVAVCQLCAVCDNLQYTSNVYIANLKTAKETLANCVIMVVFGLEIVSRSYRVNAPLPATSFSSGNKFRAYKPEVAEVKLTCKINTVRAHWQTSLLRK